MHRYARFAMVLAIAAVAGPALAQNIVSARTAGSPLISSTAKAIPANLSAADSTAMQAATRESLFIMRASYAAYSKGSAATKALAADLTGYHAQALSDYRGAALAAGLKAPAVTLSTDQEAKLKDLDGLSGAAFDARYKSDVVAAHDRASSVLLAHGKTKGNLIIVAQANRQGNQIVALNTKTKSR